MKSIFKPDNPESGRSRRAAWAVLALAVVFAGCGGNGRNEIRASGTIEATEVNVASPTGGRVKNLRVDEGSAVRAGDTLAVLDTGGPGFQLRQAQAGMDLADAQLSLVLKGARDEDIAQAGALVRQAEAAQQTAASDARRADELFAAGSATRKLKDDAEARLVGADAQLDAARQGLSKVRQFARPEDITSARARLDQARAVRDLAQKGFSDCFITAPVNGAVTSKAVEVGDLVIPGGTVVSISKLDTVNVMIYISERELGRVKLGAQAGVKIDASPKKVFPGKVTYISPVAEFTPKNIQTREDRVKLVFGTRIQIPNPDAELKPGMPADAVVETPEAKP